MNDLVKVEATSALAIAADPTSDGWRYGLEPRNAAELETFAKWVVESGFRKDLRAPGAAAILIAAGRTHGLGVFAALECFDIVYGRPFLRGKAARAFLLRSPMVDHFEILEDPDDQEKPERAVLLIKRKGWAEAKRVTFTLDEAKKLGLLDRKKDDGSTAQTGWHTQPGVMLVERATTKAIRRHFPDILLGLGLEDEEEEPKAPPVKVVSATPEGATLKETVRAAAPKPVTKAAPKAEPRAAAESKERTPKDRIAGAWAAIKAELGEKAEEVWRGQMAEEDLALLAPEAKPTPKRILEVAEAAELLAERVAAAQRVNQVRRELASEGGPPNPVLFDGPGPWSLTDMQQLVAAGEKQLEALRANKG